MLHKQTGAISLLWVAVISGLTALVAIIALFSMRFEHNFFGDFWHRAGADKAISAVQATARAVGSKEDTGLRKCVVNGKAVISNVDCSDANPTSKTIAIHDTKGFEAPKVPPKPAASALSQSDIRAQLIERATGEGGAAP